MPTDSGVFRDDTDTPVGGRIIRAYRRDTGALIGSTVSSDGQAVPGDQYLSDRVLLIRGSGASITDESPSPAVVTLVGNVAINDLRPKDGASSIYFDGAGDYLQLDGAAKLALGTGDFTIEMWAYLPSEPVDVTLFDFRPASGNGAYQTLSLTPTDISYYTQTAERIVAAHGLTSAGWYHFALCRAAGVSRVFVHGAQKGADYADTINYAVGANRPVFGALGYNTSINNLNGAAVDIRVSKRAEYTSSFTPPPRFYANAPAAATPLGSYSITHSHTGERQFVFLDDAGGTTYNDKILRVV